jgi:hypothetical protein
LPTGYLFHPLIFLTPALLCTPHQLSSFHSAKQVQSPTVTPVCLLSARRSLVRVIPHCLHMRTTLQVTPHRIYGSVSSIILDTKILHRHFPWRTK